MNSNAFSAADMTTAAANGHRDGYQAGYADAVKAVEVGKPAAAQEAVAQGCDELRLRTDGERAAYREGIEEGKRISAPVAAAPTLDAELAQDRMSELCELERDVLDSLPAVYYMDPPDGGNVSLGEQVKRMAEDAALWRKQSSAPAAPGIDLEQFRALAEACEDMRAASEECDIGEGLAHAVPFHLWNEFLSKLDAAQQAPDASPKGGSDALSRAYGYLWHVNHPEDIPTGHPYMSADRAAVEARKELRDMLTHEQRGEGINWARQKLLAAMQATSAEVGE